jgi:hypothetical protein
VAKLNELGHQAIAASPETGVSILTGEGLADVLAGAEVVVDRRRLRIALAGVARS